MTTIVSKVCPNCNENRDSSHYYMVGRRRNLLSRLCKQCYIVRANSRRHPRVSFTSKFLRPDMAEQLAAMREMMYAQERYCDIAARFGTSISNISRMYRLGILSRVRPGEEPQAEENGVQWEEEVVEEDTNEQGIEVADEKTN